MMMNKRTNGLLVMDIGDPIVSPDEAYACTTTTKETPPCGRSILYLKKVNEEEGDDIVHYGEHLRFVTNPYIFHKPLYLHSTQLTPQIFARFSRNCEVSLHSKAIYNTVWTILPPDGVQSPLIGRPVQANTELLVVHCGTQEYLSNDFINYSN